MKEIGERLRMLRESAKISQMSMAELVGVQQSRIHRFEQGTSTPNPQTFIKYADYFDVSLDYLYCRTDQPQGKIYECQPQYIKERATQNPEMREFIEMCFDPNSPINENLKNTLLRMFEEVKKE